jgi:undecaprenyl-diphosphatase
VETWQAIVMGVVQGLTEFLPISSTAHLRIVPELWWGKDPGAAFTAVIQLGTLLAVLIFFRQDIARLTVGFLRGLWRRRPFEEADSRMAWLIILGTVPIVVLGFAFKEHIKGELRSLYVISAALILVGLLMAAAEEVVKVRVQSRTLQKGMSELSWVDSLVVGFCQALALVPGTSRSGATITGGLFLGLSREAAARFSFLLSLPAVFAAAVLELFKERKELLASRGDIVNLVLATVVAGVVGYLSIAFLLRYLRTHSLYLFVAYRVALAALLLALLHSGGLKPLPQ